MRINNLWKTVLHLGFSAVFLLIFVAAAYPCKCVKKTLKGHYKSADAVVIAKIAEITEKADNSVEVTLSISESWKSNLPETLVIIIEKTTCEYELKVGEEHLLYLDNFEANKWTTNKCMGNTLKIHSSAIRKWLKKNGNKAKVV